jgi:mannose-6-phosphate isomerase-like protein (cupin superfamily)
LDTGAGLLVRAADAEVLEFPGGSTMRLLAETVGTITTITAHRSIIRAGAEGATPHHHRATTEVLYIVAGSLQLLVGDEVVEAGQGDLVVIAPGVTHAFAATPHCDAEVVDLVTPGIARFDFFRRLSSGRDSQFPQSRADDQDHYDTYADDNPQWRAARQTTPRTP